MKNNPFTSEIFNSVWLKHFNHSKPSYTFDFIQNVAFYKRAFLPLYINIGKNLTKGIYYNLVAQQNDFKGKAFLIYDVPDYFNVNEHTALVSKNLGLKKIYQYKGYLMDLTNFATAEDYRKEQFKKKNKRYIRWSHIKRLETCFDITDEFVFGEVSDEKYEFIFNHFYRLLSARFEEKNTDYHHLHSNKWQFYKDLILPLIRSKQASFLVIYNEGIPIGINLNYHGEGTLFKAITVFDTDYYKFSIGKLSVLKLLDWCYEHDYSFSDFSKGYFDYKEIWSNTQYDFNYHLLYDKSSIIATVIANTIAATFNFKSYLRKNNINHIYRKIIFKFKGAKQSQKSLSQLKIETLSEFKPSEDFDIITNKDEEYRYLTKHVNSFLFSNPEHYSNISVFKNLKTNVIIIKGTSKAIQLSF
ncbi:Acetyltransferase (GNAT) domain-containing protein [Formosa sp. Hel1_31_208]|uniref:GNAT family N-acetyltransferase n=1 Tax=Formosa sp. Hel1_31_208 TaxID=1798225 RepID=UPI000879CF4F|nr:GNAT family N-acetyltransferase [Formosa sp. Hel1_31_208]SDS38252.1 Acetyltransferase (GNAT) domain-containing protein [Formosa sp. Hel1_31_208]